MEPLNDADLYKLKELLRHAGEFIAYFELAETKMIQWRQELEEQTQTNSVRINHQLDALHQEFVSLEKVLTQAGLARLRLTLEDALKQGEAHVAILQKTSEHFLNEINTQHHEFSAMVTSNIDRIEQHTHNAILQIDKQLAKYDNE